MADKKISALPPATTPLAGTEVLPVVQSGVTDQVSVANLTAGRAVSALSYSATDGYQFRATDNTTYELLRVIDGTVNPGAFIKARAATKDVTLFASGSSVAGQRLMLGAEAVEDVVRVSKDNVTVSYGNVVIGTAGKGIDFSANGGDVLTQYDEGTFTPTVEGSTTAGTATYAAQSAKYTRIGNTVCFEIYLVWSAGTGTGELRVAGLPFTSSAGAPFGIATAPVFINIALTALNYCTGAYILSSDTKMRFFQTPVGGGAGSAVTYSAAGECMLSGFYFV